MIFISTKLLKLLFNDIATVEKSNNGTDYYILIDCLLINKYPTKICGEFVAGIIDGFLFWCGYKIDKCYAVITTNNKNAIIISPSF